MKPVLLVEDEDICNFIMSRTLKMLVADLKIITARNGKEAMHSLETLFVEKLELPSIIFLDINMPVMDGFEFLAAYNATAGQNCGIKVVMVSSSNNLSDVARARSLGVTDFLQKPVDINMLSDFYKFLV